LKNRIISQKIQLISNNHANQPSVIQRNQRAFFREARGLQQAQCARFPGRMFLFVVCFSFILRV